MKDKLFIDTNVMLDLFGEREPFYYSNGIATIADKGKVKLIVSALSYSIVNVIYKNLK